MSCAIENKRVTQLVELTANDVVPNDLMLIIDINAKESKKIRVSELGTWLETSGSFYALRAIIADTASYISSSNIHGLIDSSSYSLFSLSSSYTQNASTLSSSYSLTASYALNGGTMTDTASYLLYSGTVNGTASYAITASSANLSTNTLNLLYFGSDNGTASYAITASYVSHTAMADTASYFSGSIDTASYSLFSQQSGISNETNFLIFNPFASNGTASYAMSAPALANTIMDYGVVLADTQSTYMSQLDTVDVLWSSGNEASTSFEALGTAILPYVHGITPANGTIYLIVMDRNTGFKTELDYTPIYHIVTSGDGTLKVPFSLMGQEPLYGSYMVFVSASNGASLESTRTVRFNVASRSDVVSVYPSMPISFSADPSSSVLFTFSTATSGPFYTDYITGLYYTMSVLNGKIYELNAINQNISSINYFWALPYVTASNFSNNFPLTNIQGVPNTLMFLSCSNCALTTFYSFASSSLTVFNCNNNLVTSLPDFPSSMSYINCSDNSLISLNLPLTLSYLDCSSNQIALLPDPLPSGSAVLLADNNVLQLLPSSLPDTIVTLSLNYNSSLISFNPALPLSLTYLSVNNSTIGSLPTIPSGVLYLSAHNSNLIVSAMDNIVNNLVSNGLSNGFLDITGNGPPSPGAQGNINSILIPLGWTASYDP
jgi:hypothetical protein